MRRTIVIRSLLATALLLSLMAGASQAAGPAGAGRAGAARGGQGGQAMEKIKQVLDSLNLSTDQSKQIDQILDETRQDIAAAAKDLKGASQEERRQKLQPILKDMMEKIRGVLTDDQKKELREKMQERRQENGGKNAPTTAPNADIVPLPSTQPSADSTMPPATRGPMIQHMADRLAQLDLTPDQKTKINAILDKTADQLQSLRNEAGGNPDAIREKAMSIFQNTRQQVAAVLTPDQQDQWKAMRENALPQQDTPKATNNSQTPNSTAVKTAAASSTTQPDVAQSSNKTNSPKALFAGADAPPFRLKRLGGSTVTLDSFMNRPLVLIFGSYSSPTFRDKVQQVDQLAHRYQGRASFLIVYTREAYPANEWDVQRNLSEQIKVEQHKTLEDRQHMAKLARDALKIQTDIAVDDIDDAATDAYDAMPNGAYVLLNGKIIARQKWADPLGLPTFIDAAIKKSRTS